MASRANKISDLPKYIHKHFTQTRQIFGEKVNSLYLLEETDTMYNSIASWSFCMGDLNVKKDGFELSSEYPTLTDKNAITILEIKSLRRKPDWASSNEVSDLLRTWFPNKEIKINFELHNILAAFAYSKLTKTSDMYDAESNSIDFEFLDSRLVKRRRFDYIDAKYEIGKNLIVCPYIFSDATSMGRHDGEFIFAVTEDKVYVDIRTSI